MECLLPFASLHISLHSSNFPSDIQAVLRLELHSAHTEHIFHALTDTSDTGATALAGAGKSRAGGAIGPPLE